RPRPRRPPGGLAHRARPPRRGRRRPHDRRPGDRRPRLLGRPRPRRPRRSLQVGPGRPRRRRPPAGRSPPRRPRPPPRRARPPRPPRPPPPGRPPAAPPPRPRLALARAAAALGDRREAADLLAPLLAAFPDLRGRPLAEPEVPRVAPANRPAILK